MSYILFSDSLTTVSSLGLYYDSLQTNKSTLSTGRAGPGPAYFYWPSALALEGRAKAAGPWPRASSTRGHGGRARVGPGPARGHPL